MKKFSVKPRLFSSSPSDFGMQGERAKHWVWLGRLAEVGPYTNIRFDTGSAHVVALFGKRGSGKSYTLGTLLEGLCTSDSKTSISDSSQEIATLLFDTLGIYQWMNIAVAEDSGSSTIREQRNIWRGWDLKAEKLNTSIWIPKGSREADTPSSHTEFTIRCSDLGPDDLAYLLGLDLYRDRMGQLLNDVHAKVTIEGWQVGDRAHKAKEKYGVQDLINCIDSDNDLATSYATETRRSLRQQLASFARNPLFGETGVPLTELLTPGRLSVIVMNKMSDELRLVLVGIFLRQIIASRIHASEAEKTLKLRDDLEPKQKELLNEIIKASVPATWVAIDEAQNMLPSERTTTATNVIVKYVREGRNYGLSFVIATQQPTSVDSRILAQVDTIISHKLTVQGDIDYIKRNLKSNIADETKFGSVTLDIDTLLRSLDTGQAFITNTETDRAFLIEIRPRVSAHGGF